MLCRTVCSVCCIHPRGGGEAQGVRSNRARHCHRPRDRDGRSHPRLVKLPASLPCPPSATAVAVASVGRLAGADGPPTGPSFVSSLPSLLAAPPPPPPPQIQMKCLGMRQSITQSTPSPHEVLRRASEEREGGRGHSRIRSCTSSRRAETATGEPRRVRTATTDSLTPEAPHRCTATATECKFRLVR